MKGIIITMAAGGAVRERRERRLIKEARRMEGRCLEGNLLGNNEWEINKTETYVELKKSSVIRKKRARCLRCRTSLFRKVYKRV